jgi:hypothetical protein
MRLGGVVCSGQSLLGPYVAMRAGALSGVVRAVGAPPLLSAVSARSKKNPVGVLVAVEPSSEESTQTLATDEPTLHLLGMLDNDAVYVFGSSAHRT